MPAQMQTGRGVYLLTLDGEPEYSGESVLLRLSLEHQHGIERFGLRLRIGPPLYTPGLIGQEAQLLDRLAQRIVRDFEKVREAALKSITSEGKLLELNLDR